MCVIRIFAKNMGDSYYEPTILVLDNLFAIAVINPVTTLCVAATMATNPLSS